MKQSPTPTPMKIKIPNASGMVNLILRLGRKESKEQRLDEMSGFYKVQSVWIRGIKYDYLPEMGYIVVFYFNILTTQGPSNPMGKQPTIFLFEEKTDLLNLLNQTSMGAYYVNVLSTDINASGNGGFNSGMGQFKVLTWNELFDLLNSYEHEAQKALDYVNANVALRSKNEVGDLSQRVATIKNRNSSLKKSLYARTKENEKNAFDEAKKGLSVVGSIASMVGAGLANPIGFLAGLGKSIFKKQVTKPLITAGIKGAKKELGKEITIGIGYAGDIYGKTRKTISTAKSLKDPKGYPKQISKKGLNSAKTILEERLRDISKIK